MWKANKAGILALLAGGLLLGSVYMWLLPGDELLAKRVLCTGICLLLLGVGAFSWISALKP